MPISKIIGLILISVAIFIILMFGLLIKTYKKIGIYYLRVWLYDIKFYQNALSFLLYNNTYEKIICYLNTKNETYKKELEKLIKNIKVANISLILDDVKINNSICEDYNEICIEKYCFKLCIKT